MRPMVTKMSERSQGATEYLLMLGAVLVLVAGIVASIFFTSQTLGSNVSGQIDNVMENVVIPSLVGTLF
ncbi:MAG: hypothetical protein GH150_06545 [Hadesarchaea archaeon]|nr:hypothetical protein [Hadesarchaea archaeon]